MSDQIDRRTEQKQEIKSKTKLIKRRIGNP